MNKIYFSPENLGFYIDGVSVIPADAVCVSADTYNDFAGIAWPEGKELSSDKSGNPIWVDAPPKTDAELIALAESEKSRLRASADSEIEWRQDAVDAGIATEEEIAALAEWKKYRVLLMRVDTTDPVWPASPLI
ncbi:tail fiber assembly protein [Escherichia coli]|uniref:tail fiber assembly protein n=1 Tax=Escherichia coli TaxID=562 RepID=UPI00224864C6|nr:tail fiber assembly protein [Escherichia coli]EEZ9630597.1 tail fiber assembly protein [Escherichia coli]EKR5565300.1 tail fiber assembly protein [Escherichia coli]MCX0218741.1 tail fiber assembly protein [Escherichia coli]